MDVLLKHKSFINWSGYQHLRRLMKHKKFWRMEKQISVQAKNQNKTWLQFTIFAHFAM